MYNFYKFTTRGVGIVSTVPIVGGTLVGEYYSKNIQITPNTRHVYDGWIETSPLGRFLNHSPQSNLRLILEKNAVKAYAVEDIAPEVELTVNYIEAANTINLPNSYRVKYNFYNFTYENENIFIQKAFI